MHSSIFAFLSLLLVGLADAFTIFSRAPTFRPLSMKWNGDRPPLPNMEILNQRMDASWGRGKFRTEVWDDNVNPMNDWWTAYAPSDEQIEACAQGYDFKNPQAWFEVRSAFEYDSMMRFLLMLHFILNRQKISIIPRH
jgi:hypothetical protein